MKRVVKVHLPELINELINIHKEGAYFIDLSVVNTKEQGLTLRIDVKEEYLYSEGDFEEHLTEDDLSDLIEEV